MKPTKTKFFIGLLLIIIAITTNYYHETNNIKQTLFIQLFESLSLLGGGFLVGMNMPAILRKFTLFALFFVAIEGINAQSISFNQDIKLLLTEDSYQNKPPTIDIIAKYTSKQKCKVFYSLGIEFADLKTPYLKYSFGIGKFYFNTHFFDASIELQANSILHNKFYLPTANVTNTFYFKIDKNIGLTQVIQVLNRPDINAIRASFYFGFIYHIKKHKKLRYEL